MRVYIAVAAVAMFLSTGIALAHPQLDHAIPPVGSTVASPSEIRIFFSEPLIPTARSSISLAPDGGAPLAMSNSPVNTADPAQMVLKVPSLAPGNYLVRWRAIGIDGHEMSGDYPFEVSR
jgi:copper resistance protein C